MRKYVPQHKAPLALAGFLALPLFFASLMATSLAIERPHAFEWMRHGRLFHTFHDPLPSNELRIWVLSFVPPLLLVAIGWAASFLSYGIYISSVAAIVEAYALTIRLEMWARHHTLRFPFGEDNYPDSSNSSLVDRGQWEREAVNTVHSLVRYTIGLALASMAIALVLALRRKRPPVETIVSELQQTGGAPTVSGS
ncbi:MAG TPA: hypothetical protein VH108_05280 [Gaiellaceae bacterium]|nr:hypothetical protein [Gaiellaceae bacterium]